MARSPLLDHNRVERLALADLFETLDDEQLSTPSLCSAWTVGDVLGHLASPILLPKADIAKQFLRTPSFRSATVAWTEQVQRFPVREQIEALRTSADHPFIPPGAGPVAPLTDAIIHGEDVRVPLGLRRDVPAEHLRPALDFGTSLMAVPFFLPFRRLNGLRLVAGDLGWSHGSGALIEGPAQELALAMFGRVAAAAPSLSGPGVEVLARRCS